MIKKKYKIFIYLGVASVLLGSCGTVKKAFDPERKNSSQEFLVEKKQPLSMPPDFNELAIPQINNQKKENQVSNIESLITSSKPDTSQKIETENVSGGLEKSILDKIKDN